MKKTVVLVGSCAAISVVIAAGVSLAQAHQPIRLGPFWQLTGNQLTDPSEDFLGTTDAKALIFKTDALGGGGERMRIDSGGNVGIGVAAPARPKAPFRSHRGISSFRSSPEALPPPRTATPPPRRGA